MPALNSSATKFLMPNLTANCQNSVLTFTIGGPDALLLSGPTLEGNDYVITPLDLSLERKYSFDVTVTDQYGH